jgi:glycosyltransferase involved in cell wall biosynthesis
MKVLLIGNLCAHYRVKLFELLDKMFDIKFLFFSEGEKYYDGQRYLGDFKGQYLWGVNLIPKVRINPGLIYELLFYDYDILIKCINSPLLLFLSFVISKIRGKKFILWTGIWHHPATLFHKFFFPFVKFIYRHVDAIGVYGTHVKKYLLSLGIDEKKIFIFQKAADNTLYNKIVSLEQMLSLRHKLNIADRKVILYVGRLEEVKGIDYLIEAYRKLGRNDTTLILIGRGNYRERLEHLAAAHGLNGNVLFMDYVDNDKLCTYYSIADVFILPSVTTKTFKEPWGMVINEAMNQGCPIVTTDAVGAAAGGLVRNGINGFVVPEKNSEALRDALDNILNNENLKNKMRANSKRAVAEYTVERKAEGFKEAIAFVNAN